MENGKVIFFGAGEHADLIFNRSINRTAPRALVAFVDSDVKKQGKNIHGVPILSFNDANMKYPDAEYYVTANERFAPQIIGFLLENGIPKERIINYEPVEIRFGCAFEGTLLVHFIGDFISLTSCDAISQGGAKRKRKEIQISPNELNSETFSNAMYQIRSISDRIINRDIPDECKGCQFVKKQYYFSDRKIRRIMFGGHLPCNYKCLHCTNTELFSLYKSSAYDDLNKVMDIVESFEQIDKNAVIAFGVGEFTVDKNHFSFLNRISSYTLMLHTNGYLYSSGIYDVLKNKNSCVYISIDAGTAKTYEKIKGVNGFSRVCENLEKYSAVGNAVLKYIIFDGINTNDYDIDGFISLADKFANKVVLSRDFYSKNALSDEALKQAAKMISHFRRSGKMSSITGFKREGEQIRLLRYIEEIENDK